MHGKKSLQRKAFLMTLTVSIVLLLLISGINIILNFIGTMRNYKRETAYDMKYAVSVIGSEYLEKITSSVWDRYQSIPEDIKSNPFSEEYMMMFSDLVDDDFWKAREILVKCTQQTGLDSISVVIPDVEKERMIFVVDGYDLEGAYMPRCLKPGRLFWSPGTSTLFTQTASLMHKNQKKPCMAWTE